jgi:nitroreductase
VEDWKIGDGVEETSMNQAEKHVFDAIFGRRSIRAYLEDKQVEHEKIMKLLQAAMAAPSACNIQPWEFIVVTEKEQVSLIKQAVADHGNYDAPVVIVVCGYTEFIPWEGDQGVIDCCAAIENMLIAATAMGLGSVWIGGFDPSSIRKLLDIPESVFPVGIVYFGYAAERKKPRTRYIEEAVYWQKYDPERAHHPRPGNLVYEKP